MKYSNEIKRTSPDFVIYETNDKIAKVSVRLEDETVWLTQANLAELFQTSRPNVTMHVDPHSPLTMAFFATVQNKMHYAVHRQTAAEVVYNRVDNEKPMVGMTNFRGNYITREDVRIAKNYLSELELQKLNLLTEGFLGYAELQALEQKPARAKYSILWRTPPKFLCRQRNEMKVNPI